jgi:hypothetical protein
MSSFDKNQRAYYLNELNRSLPSSAMVDHLALERALQVHDTMIPASGTRPGETATLLSGYGMNSAAMQKDTACRNLLSPTGMRTPSDRTGCGWWFVPNPSQASTAAHGTKHGAMSPTLDSTNGSGRWIWDPQEAAQAEGLKQAARIQACPDIQYTKYPNIGWCPGTNMALVTDGNGNPAYPQAAGGDCPGGGIVTTAANCPPPPPPPGSAGGSGSFSPQTIPGSVTGECSTNPLSNACYQAILPYTGCSPNGALGLALSSGGYPGQFQPFNDVNAVMMQRGFSLDSNVVNNGNTTLQTAFDNFFALGAASASGNRAAQNACLDATLDYCPGPSDTQTANAPFPMSCIRKAGMAIGYPANSPILADNSASYWAQLQYYPTWQNVLEGLAYWMDDARKQGVDGLWDVFGIAVKVPPLPYLAIGTQFSLRPVGSIANVISWGGSQGPVVTRAPDNVAAAIANASAGNMQGGNRLLYSTALATISIWVVSPANNQVANYVSIQPFNYAGSGGIFLRHSNFQLWAQQNPGGDEQFNSDTSFQIINEGTGQISFQSYNYPDQSLTWTGDGGAQLSLAPTSSASLFIPIAPL